MSVDHFDKFHDPSPRNVALVPFLLQLPLFELEMHIGLESVGGCAQEAAKALQRNR
jgi:hypothetical protein